MEQRYITYRCFRPLALSYPSVRQSTCISAACTDRSGVKFHIGDLHKNLSRNFQMGYNRAKIGQCTYRPKCFVLILVTLKLHKTDLWELNPIRLVG